VTLPFVLRKGAIYEPLLWLLGPQAMTSSDRAAAKGERRTLRRSLQRVPGSNVEIRAGELDVTEEELASLTADGVVADVPAPAPSTGEDAE
jgi:hypothetical protein